jgi:CheY-like chemotaxis protein
MSAILVVEDDLHGQVISKSILERSGFTVDIAADAEEALQLLTEHQYQAAIIDLTLPKISGWDLLFHIRTKYPELVLPCIAVTAFHSSHVAQEALKAGFLAYFSKPIAVDEFGQQVRQLLQ